MRELHLVRSEDLNCSKIALRYSQYLTKEMVFFSIREVFRRIGEVVGGGGEVNISLPIGSIRSKERRIWFEFDKISIGAMVEENNRNIEVVENEFPSSHVEEEEAEDEFVATSSILEEEEPERTYLPPIPLPPSSPQVSEGMPTPSSSSLLLQSPQEMTDRSFFSDEEEGDGGKLEEQLSSSSAHNLAVSV